MLRAITGCTRCGTSWESYFSFMQEGASGGVRHLADGASSGDRQVWYCLAQQRLAGAFSSQRGRGPDLVLASTAQGGSGSGGSVVRLPACSHYVAAATYTRRAQGALPQLLAAVVRYPAPVVGFTCLHIKISGRDPDDLPTHFMEQLCEIVVTYGCYLPAVYVRKGCIELTLDVEGTGAARCEEFAAEDQAATGWKDSGLKPREPQTSAAATAAAPALRPTDHWQASGRDAADAEGAKDHREGRQQRVACQREDQGRGGEGGGGDRNGHGHIDLGSVNGTLALARRVHVAEGISAEGRGGGLSGLPETTPLAISPPPAAAQAVAGGSAQSWTCIAIDQPMAAEGTAVPPRRRTSVVSTVSHSWLTPLSQCPVIHQVSPRVVQLRRAGLEPPLADRVPHTGACVEEAVGRVAVADDGGSGGAGTEGPPRAPPSSSHHDVEPLLEAVHADHKPVDAVMLLVEVSAPPNVQLSELASQPTTAASAAIATAVGSSSDATGGAAETSRGGSGPVAVAPGSVAVRPASELLVRCSGRYIPVDIQSTTTTPRPVPADGMAREDAGNIDGRGGGGEATVSHSFLVTLLEPPPVSGGVMLVDLRWRGRPLQVVPVVLVDEPDDQLLTELSAVAASWTGPMHELDGLLYDVGAWLRCMSMRRSAAASTRVAEQSVGAATAAAAGDGDADAPREPIEAAAAPLPARREPLYLPVLGASLLQFAHAQGLMGMAARLQADMRRCGYTAPFRPLLRSRMLLSTRVASRPPASSPTAPMVVAALSKAASATAASIASPAPAPAPAPARASATAGTEPTLGGPAEVGKAPTGPSGPVAPVTRTFGKMVIATTGAVARQWQHCCAALLFPSRRCQGVLAAAAPLTEEESYRAFVESSCATSSYLLHLLDLLSLLLLMTYAAALVSQQRMYASDGGRGAALTYVRPLLLLVLFALASLPAALTGPTRRFLPTRCWRRVASHVNLLRHVCMATGRLATMLSCGCLSSPHLRCYRGPTGHMVGPGVLLMEGVVLPAACLLSPLTALLLAAVKLPLYIAAGLAAGAATKLTMDAAYGDCTSSLVATAAIGHVWDGRVAILTESAFRAFAVTSTALITTLACHVHLRRRFQHQRQKQRQQRGEGEAGKE